MTKIELDNLKEKLPHGFGPKLQRITGFSLPYVYQVMDGIRECPEIENAAIELALVTVEGKRTREKRLAEL